MAKSKSHKTAANALFAASQFRDAIPRYFTAIDVCPIYFNYELAVLKSNVSAWREGAGLAGKPQHSSVKWVA